jgi:cytoskeleton protein RodZ
MDLIGEELRIRRESKGLSLREVEDATKIRMKYLIALEADDFDALPGKVYVIGFLRTYARFLEMDDEELVNKVKSLSQFAEEQDEEPEKTTIKKSPGSPNLILIIAVIAALIFAGIVYTLSRDKNDKIPEESIPQTQTNSENESSDNGSAQNTQETETNQDANNEMEISGVSVTVIIREASCWMDVKIDGKNDFNGTLKAGENRTFVGQEKITIKYGNAGAVEVIVNGESIYPVGNPGQVITVEYTEENNTP